MMPDKLPAVRLLVLLLAVTAATGCPGPTQAPTDEEVRPVKASSGKKTPAPTGASTKPASTAPGSSTQPTGTTVPGGTGTTTPGGTSSSNPNGTTSANPNGTTSTAPSTATSTAPSTAASTAVSAAPSTAASAAASTSPSASASVAASTSPEVSTSPAASVLPSAGVSTSPSVGGSPTPTRENGGSVSLFAGNFEGQGNQNGTGAEALFQLPSAVAVDLDGNVYVADTGNNAIRKITPAGVVTLVAGGSQGTADGVGVSAQFNSPNGITVDDNGVVYVADTNNNLVRKIQGGQTSLLVGAGTGGQTLSAPYSVAADRLGNLYIADTNNFRILKVAAGATSAAVFAGSGNSGSADGDGTSAQFTVPASVTTDFFGNVYVADIFSLRKITADGIVSTPQISMADENEAPLVSQLRITTDRQGDGTVIYAADSENDRIYILRRDDGAGDYVATRLAGSTTGYTEGAGATAQFNDPLQLFVTSGGTLFVPDYNNNVIRRAN